MNVRSFFEVPKIRPRNLGTRGWKRIRGKGDRRRTVLRPVGLRKRQRRDTGDDQLVAPPKLQHIVHETQKCHQADRENGGVVFGQLGDKRDPQLRDPPLSLR